MSVPGRMYSSWARIGRPFWSLIVTTGLGETAFFPCFGRTALGFHGQRVGLIAGEAVFGGDDVREMPCGTK